LSGKIAGGRGVIKMKTINLKLTLRVFLLALLTAGCGFDNSMPSDKAMEENFRSREADFKKLVTMLKEDSNLAEVNFGGAYLRSHDRPKAEIPAQRINEYRRLLRQIGVDSVTNFDGKNSFVFLFWSGWRENVPHKTYKQYYYDEKPPSPLVDSLNQPEELPGERKFEAYKRIADNWYLLYSRDFSH